jgi:acyl-CoA thioester hydrolase
VSSGGRPVPDGAVRGSDGLVWVERHVPLRWNDADQLGHINHTLYLAYMSEARDRLGVVGMGQHSMAELVLARIEIDYLAEARLADEWVTARSRLLRIGNSSIRTLDEVVRPDGTVAARAESVSVMTDRDAVRSRPFTAEERAGLEALLAPVAGDDTRGSG